MNNVIRMISVYSIIVIKIMIKLSDSTNLGDFVLKLF